MTTEFLRVVKKLHHHQETESPLSLRNIRMELQPELSLAPAWPGLTAAATTPAPAARSSSSESDGTSRKKRKHHAAGAGWEEPHQQPPPSLELQLNDPLPLDWEQCLDLQVSR